MKNPKINLQEHILYIDIGEDTNTDLFRWKNPTYVLFRMDIVAARAEANEDYYRRMERANVRTVFIKKHQFIFTVAGDDSVQFQMIEALLETVADQFLDMYGDLPAHIPGFSSLFEGFQDVIVDVFEQVERDRVAWVLVPCKICGISHALCINTSVIEKATNFPITIVYLHKGIGLTVFVDAQIRVRGVERVVITG